MAFVREILDHHCVNQFLKLALKSYNEGNYQQTVESLEMIRQHDQALDRKCSDVVVFYLIEARVALAKLFWNQGNAAAAIEEYGQALNLAPKYADLHLALGRIHAGRREHAKAEKCFKKALQINPNYIEAHLSLAYLATERKRYKQAVEIFTGLSTRTHFYKQELFDKALSEAGKGDLGRAVKDFNLAFKTSPDRAETLCALGQDAMRDNSYPEAVGYFLQAKKLKPHYADIYNLLGVCYSQSNQWAKAAKALEQAVRMAPHFTRAWLNLAIAYEKLDEGKKAANACRKAAALEPHNTLASETLKRVTKGSDLKMKKRKK
jgi:tetratricopeptide (TPR) repeat protein